MNRLFYGREARTLALDRLIAEHRLVTYFQPIVDVKRLRAVGFEVLNRPDTSPEFANAADLYRFASETQQVSDLDRVSLQLGIRRFAEATTGERVLRNMQIFLNVHPNTLHAPGFNPQKTLDMLNTRNGNKNWWKSSSSTRGKLAQKCWPRAWKRRRSYSS